MKPVGTPEFSKSVWEQFLFMFILFLFYVYAAKPYAGKPCWEAGSHAEGMRLCGECADIFGVFQAEYMGSKFSKTAEVCFSEFRMAESPKSVVVEEGVSVLTGTASGSAAPMPDAGSNAMPEAPNTTTVEGLPVVPASKVTGTVSPPAPLTPMTPADEGGDKLADSDVIITQQKKKPRLHQEVSGLSERVEKACEAMNNMSTAMTAMCKEYQRESQELQEGIRAMGLQGIANKGYLATLVAFQNELKDICWQLTGSGKAQANSSMKSVGIGLGDKLVSLHQVAKELLRTSNENHKALMDGLSAVELAIKNPR